MRLIRNAWRQDMALYRYLRLVRSQALSPWFALYVAVLYFACVAILRPEIASYANLYNVLVSSAPLIALALGQSIVVITRGIDLSVTAVIAAASVVGAWVMTEVVSGPITSVFAGAAAVFLVGAIAGTIHGASVALLGMPPLLVTLVSLMFFRGLSQLFTRSRPVGGLPDGFIDLYHGGFLGIPLPLIAVVMIAALAQALLSRTVFGRRLHAVGRNSLTARVSGVPISRTVISAYVLCGLGTSLATLLYMMRLEAGKPALVDESVLLDTIAAVVIGGVSLSGGRGTAIGAALGAVFLTLVNTSLDLFGHLQIWHVVMIKGSVVLLAASLEVIRERIAEGEGVAS